VRPSVIWLQFQECTGCTESLLRTAHPAFDDLIFDLISLDYHETLLAAAGHQAEAALKQAMRAQKGKYVCVVEGAIPTKENGIYCMIGGRTALDIVQDVAGLNTEDYDHADDVRIRPRERADGRRRIWSGGRPRIRG
jgi:hydrogenase small subunit